ncbi:MAG: glycosyltransferase [Prolixibacteraceae bacterium]|nr:glycosyltransferase [Prolixibacteraceae bacterium]
MTIAGYILFAFLVLRFLVLLVNFLYRPYLPKAKHQAEWPMVSVLIPARNEENNLPTLLTNLQNIDYPNYEVIVCNDSSTDGTEQLLSKFSTQFPQLSFFNNEPLPEAWIGKNFACHQLAQKASGQFLLFIDADVKVQPQLLKKSISYMQKQQTKLLSIFPEQIIKTTGEWKTVPLMNWILLSFLPLPLVRWRWFSSLSAANGQFMLFDADNYRNNLWHKKVALRNVEDILIARSMKKQKMRISVLLGNNDIACRMYNGYQQAIKGFALNMHQYFSGYRLWMAFFVMATWLRLPFFVLSGQFWLLGISIVLLATMKLMYARLSFYPLSKVFAYHYSQLFSFLSIGLHNLRNKQKGSMEWKGRKYEV